MSSLLRAVLDEARAASGEVDVAGIATRLRIGRDEVEAMLRYWAGRGRVSLQAPGGDCRSVAGCRLAAGCPAAGGSGPVVIDRWDRRPCDADHIRSQTAGRPQVRGPS